MTDSEENNRFLKGITLTLGIVVSIQGAWAVYTQGNRFTSYDGERLEARIERMDTKLDALEVQAGRILEQHIHMMERIDAVER